MVPIEQGRQPLEQTALRVPRQARDGDVPRRRDPRLDTTVRQRVPGVDVARGVALFGMIATHVIETANDGPTTADIIAGGRSAATFALVAGVSVAFLSGGRLGVHGVARTAAARGLATRALLIGAIGLLLGATGTGIDVILTYYALLFVVVIPLLGLAPRALAALSAVLVALGPVLLVGAARLGLDFSDDNPTLESLVTDPVRQLAQFLVSGEYPVVLYLAYVCVGLALGRLDLTSRRLAGRLLAGGIALAVAARAVSLVLLYRFGGLDRLLAVPGTEHRSEHSATELLWSPEQGTSWWYLALSSPHAHTPLDLAHTLGSAMAVLGAALLLTRSGALRRVLAPVGAAGAMTLTLYTAHIFVLEAHLLEDHSVALYLLLVAAFLVFAVVWRARVGQGPLERLVAEAAGRARAAVPPRAGARGA